MAHQRTRIFQEPYSLTDLTLNFFDPLTIREACGGPNRLSVYSSTVDITALPVPVAKTTDLPGNWEYAGCYTYASHSLPLSKSIQRLTLNLNDRDTNTRVLKWQTIAPTNNSVDNCANNCARFGYTAAGLEYGQECCKFNLSPVLSSIPVLIPCL